MKIIVGLGNPGKKYENTRHNVGFLGLDKIVIKSKVESYKVEEFKFEKKFNAEVAKIKIGDQDIILVKPQTFMNLSGEAVKKIVDFYKINPVNDLIVVHDDIDIPLGKVKLASGGSSAGHKGIESIIENLGSQGFVRVRIGVGRPSSSADKPENEQMKVENWVLQQFSEDEEDILYKVIDELIEQGLGYLVR